MSVFAESIIEINSSFLTRVFNELKNLYNINSIDENKKSFIKEQIQKYGYLPYPQMKALEELTEAETLFALEEKLKVNSTYKDEEFIFEHENISPVVRAGYKNSDWVKKEGHNIKLINLAGLGNGNTAKEPGKFIDWLRQLVILPSGNPYKGILSTTMYLIPFHPREFGCAYLPKSSEVSKTIGDTLLSNKIGLDAKNQVRLFIALTQLAGHPVMYDILPQTGRFSKTVLASPYVARWFDIKSLNDQLNQEAERIALESKHNNPMFIEKVKSILQEELTGKIFPVTDELKELYEIFNKEFFEKKKELSNIMLSKENQEIISVKAKEIICDLLGKPANSKLTEEHILNHDDIIKSLVKEGLWPAPGGAWCSSGVPIFDKMNEGGSYPMFRHFSSYNEDVTHFANLDCQTPYYFFHFDKYEYNPKVIDFYVNFLKKLQKDYNFDGFRVDHIDHIVDGVSEKDGLPISYRAPRKVLAAVNNEIKNEIPHFATLAEYMLWDNFLWEYHADMNFDLLWGNDIISQYAKTVNRIIEDNNQLEVYNNSSEKQHKLSILKIYNNQDGEFREINQYPGQLGEDGALFKWFKLKFTPGGKLSSRPVMFIDGDESYTQKGIESVIGAEISMTRNNNYEFFRKFDAINRFALSNEILLDSRAWMINHNSETGFVTWIITSENSNNKLFIVANEKPPTEVIKNAHGEYLNVENHPFYNVDVYIPDGSFVISEYVLEDNSLDFSEKTEISNLYGNKFWFKKLNPSEFHIYKIGY